MSTIEFISIIHPYEFQCDDIKDRRRTLEKIELKNRSARIIEQSIKKNIYSIHSKFAKKGLIRIARTIKISSSLSLSKKKKEGEKAKGEGWKDEEKESWGEEEVGCWRRYGGRRGWRRDALAPSNAETLRWCWLHVPTHLKSPGVSPSPHTPIHLHHLLESSVAAITPPRDSLTCVHVHFLHLTPSTPYLFVRVTVARPVARFEGETVGVKQQRSGINSPFYIPHPSRWMDNGRGVATPCVSLNFFAL